MLITFFRPETSSNQRCLLPRPQISNAVSQPEVPVEAERKLGTLRNLLFRLTVVLENGNLLPDIHTSSWI